MSKKLLYAIEIDDNGTPKIKNFGKAVKKSEKQTDRLSGSIDKSERSMGRMATATSKMVKILPALGAAAGIAAASMAAFAGVQLAKAVFATGMSFEKLGVQLKTLKGAEGAKRDLEWIAKFTRTTPFQLNQVAESFVRLEAYGLSGQRWMKTLGDTASSMGKDLNDAVEMFADAMTGEFERLKEFGVKAKTQGDQVTFSWTQNGEAMQITAEKTAQGISAALGKVFKRFEGGMEAQSKTLEGMMSNLSDQWTGFLRTIADSGVFEFVKDQVAELLNWITILAEDGTLETWARRISETMVTVARTIRENMGPALDILRGVAQIGSFVANNNPIAHAARMAQGQTPLDYYAGGSGRVGAVAGAVSDQVNQTYNQVVNNVISPMFMTGDRSSMAEAVDQMDQQEERFK